MQELLVDNQTKSTKLTLLFHSIARMKISLSLLLLCLVSRHDSVTEAFLLLNSGGISVTPCHCRHHQVRHRRTVESMGQRSLNMIASTSSSRSYANSKDNNKKNQRTDDEGHFLLKQYVTASGEIVNPYNVLQVPRNANRADIKGSYKHLAKRYHPDGARNRAILPGKWYVHRSTSYYKDDSIKYSTWDGKSEETSIDIVLKVF
jgi:DnaJ domain